MAWIKRNLYFLIGSVVAVALLGVAGFYTYSKWKLNKENLQNLNAAYVELDAIIRQNPNGGNKDIDNISRANVQRTNVLGVMATVSEHFAPIPAVPNTPKVSDQEFYTALRR